MAFLKSLINKIQARLTHEINPQNKKIPQRSEDNYCPNDLSHQEHQSFALQSEMSTSILKGTRR